MKKEETEERRRRNGKKKTEKKRQKCVYKVKEIYRGQDPDVQDKYVG